MLEKLKYICFKYLVIPFVWIGIMSSALCQDSIPANPKTLNKNLIECMDNGLRYLQQTQRQYTKQGVQYKGEWSSLMSLRTSFFYLGSKKSMEDSNCFAVAATHNAIANIYLLYPEYSYLEDVLNLAFDKIMTYRNGDRYNFWNLLPPTIPLRRGARVGQQPWTRRPTTYPLRSKYIHNAANVVEDADDTGLAYTAIALRKRYKRTNRDSICLHTHGVSHIFEAYRDHNRNNLHWYNYLYGNDRNTGAYLTWLGQEYQFESWNVLKVIGHNATFFLPISECYPFAYQPYIPYGSNDLDAVVNANVLATLSYYDELDAEGVEHAVKFIERKVEKRKYDRVGIYYPNRYHFPYAVSKAFTNGVAGLERSAQILKEFLLETQNENGSWSARRRLNNRDELQSTAYAMNALINIGDLEDPEIRASLHSAIQYLLENVVKDENGMHWDGGVFFSGGTVVRNILWWKSDAYTTAIILEGFAKYRKHLESAYGN